MKKAMTLILALLLVLSIYSPTPIHSEATKVVITADSLKVRSGPGLSYPVVYGVKQNESYEVISKEGDWIKIKLSRSATGWIASWFAKEQSTSASPSTPKTEVKTEQKMVSNADGLRIRKGPGTSFQVVGSVNKGDVLEYKEKSESWVRISYQQFEGWVHSDYLNGIPTEEKKQTPNTTVLKKGKVKATSLKVREKGSLTSAVIGSLNNGDSVSIYGEQGSWYEIALNASTRGWVHRDYITISKSEEQPKNEDKPQTTTTAVVTATILNVRDQNTLDGKVIDKVKKGDKLTVLYEQNNWSQVKLPNGKEGWVAGWYLEKTTSSTTPEQPTDSNESIVTILYDTTNIRKGPSTSDSIVARANQGDTFTIIEKVKDWYKIALGNGKEGYVAGWIVTTTGSIGKVEKPGMNQYLEGKTIVIDPGHGGADSGAIGVKGNFEKTLTLRTAKLLDEKLRAAGAKTVVTRSQDVYVSLSNRVSLSNYYQADAFLSLHYDSTVYPSANGITTYYYDKSKDYKLAETLQSEMIKQTSFTNRGVKYGNLQVLRQNKRPSALLELGFLSNISEEAHVMTATYQDRVTTAIFNGLAQQFK
ncbi:SH3 domain-containing protein [Bacillus sp. BGMRC 2118]|nr:SH3 domain-containing protein [Bacillus sp. BGMRC 2118]